MHLKAELEILMSMTPAERKLHHHQERVAIEEYQLQWMIDCNKNDDEFIQYAVEKAKDCVWWHKQDGDPEHLLAAEMWAELARSYKANKYTIADIRKQRERLQWAKKKLRMMQQHDEQSHSSEASKT